MAADDDAGKQQLAAVAALAALTDASLAADRPPRVREALQECEDMSPDAEAVSALVVLAHYVSARRWRTWAKVGSCLATVL